MSKTSDGISRATSDNESRGGGTDRSGEGKQGDGDDVEQDESADKAGKQNKVLPELNNVFSTMNKEIKSKCDEKLKEIKKLYAFHDDVNEEWEAGPTDPLDELVQEMNS